MTALFALVPGGASETIQKKAEIEANREMRNMLSGDDLNRYCPHGGQKMNPIWRRVKISKPSRG
jgi:hypothetical protein